MYLYEGSNNQLRNVRLSGFADPPPGPFQKSVEAIEKALKRNPVGGYVKGSAARTELDAAFASVPPCDAVKLYRELRFGTSPLAKLFKYRVHPKTFGEMLGVLKAKMSDCFVLLRQKVKAAGPGPCLSSGKDKIGQQAAENICHNAELLCKVAAELDEPDGWSRCEAAMTTCGNAMFNARSCDQVRI